jgi:hypothetical protein
MVIAIRLIIKLTQKEHFNTMCRAIVINLQNSNKICISRKVILIHSETGSSHSSEDDSVVLYVDSLSLEVDTIDWEKYAVSMHRAEVH